MKSDLIIRNVEVGGCPGLDVRIDNGVITEIGAAVDPGTDERDGQGGALIPGLVDHHIHLFALAARVESVDLTDVRTRDAFEMRMVAAAAARPEGNWIRAVGYHETFVGTLNACDLDAIAPHHPVRVQHQTGALWVLNTQALAVLIRDGEFVPFLERDVRGEATGRLWRGDSWLRERLPTNFPSLTGVGRLLASYGVTAVTDASASTDERAARQLGAAVRDGSLPQNLTLMSAGILHAPSDGAFKVGAVKILLDDHDLPSLETFAAKIAQARQWGRNVAVHCVTEAELALTLAAFDSAGASPGDRVEHGGMISRKMIAMLHGFGLTIVTQPNFIFERGDRYVANIPSQDLADLYRCATLVSAGVGVTAGSDAPYGSPDPWIGIAAAIGRRTRDGRMLSEIERIDPKAALDLYLGDSTAPGRHIRRVVPGAAADLCLLKPALDDALAAPASSNVRATFLRGRLIYESS